MLFVCFLRLSSRQRQFLEGDAQKCSWQVCRKLGEKSTCFFNICFVTEAVEKVARSTPGKISAAIEALAVALRRIPAILSDNAGEKEKNFWLFC